MSQDPKSDSSDAKELSSAEIPIPYVPEVWAMRVKRKKSESEVLEENVNANQNTHEKNKVII